ncbi:MAG: efflux RND transporter periplasmic adaptor subunit [Desulfobulbaceae bacterium]|nr:efflux RND transporter periplasmic adaptor subunit [Desulfobulbaceae bacterium]
MIQRLAKVSLFLALLVLAGCRADEKSSPKAVDLPVAEVRTMTVAAHEGHLQTEVVGTVRAVNEALIASKITGTIAEMPVVLGSVVKKDELLVKISAAEISARVLQAQTQMEQARRNLEREQKLLQKQAATPEKVKSLEEMYAIAEAAHREAFSMLSYTTISAPFDGVITSKIASVGDLATPGAPLLRMENSDSLQVEASIPEALILQIKTGDMLGVHIPVVGLDLQGVVAEIAPVADPFSRTATVKINIDSLPQLRTGQFARVIIPGSMKESLFVPSAAVHTFGQMERIFVISDNKAHLRLIRTGAGIGDQVEILAGLDPGEVIAVTNSSELVDGQPVKAVQ